MFYIEPEDGQHGTGWLQEPGVIITAAHVVSDSERVTVRQAVKLLSDEGLVSPQRGRGTLVNGLPARERSLRVHTTFAGLVDMYRDDKPVLTNLVESDASPVLLEGDGIAAPSYVHMRRVHARRGIKPSSRLGRARAKSAFAPDLKPRNGPIGRVA